MTNDKPELPPLPENVWGYGADEVRAYARAAVAAAVERCVAACQGESLEDEPTEEGDIAYMFAIADCIRAIRATLQPPPTTTTPKGQ